jgi:hypothetical protein
VRDLVCLVTRDSHTLRESSFVDAVIKVQFLVEVLFVFDRLDAAVFDLNKAVMLDYEATNGACLD